MNVGLKPMTQQYVHLSADEETAYNVGKRRREPVVLLVDCEKMHSDGYEFYISENRVWLTKEVPAKYIKSL